MFPQRFAHQRGTVLFRSPRGLVGGLQEVLIKNDLDCLHMWTPLHSILHIQILKFEKQLFGK
jgi:hypothetical protein